MSKRNSFKKDSIKRNERISGVLQKQPSFNSHQKLFFHTKQPYYTLQDKANPDAPPTYQIYRGPSQPLTNQTLNNLSTALANNVNLPSTNPITNTTLSSPPLQSQRPKNILSELVVSTGDELVFQTKKSDIENALKLIKSIEDRFMEDHLQQDKIFLSRINSYTNGYIPLLHLTAYSDISKYSQNNLEYMAHAIETYSNHLELNPERTHVKRKGQGTAVPLEELIANLVPVAKRTLVALNIDSTQVQKQQEVLNQCRYYIKEMEEKEEEEEKKRNDISQDSNTNNNKFNINPNESQITSILIPHSVRIAYIEDPRDYRNMFYKPEDLCKDIFEPMDSIAYALIEFDSEKTANYVYGRFKNDRKKNKTNILMKKRFRNLKKFNNNNNNNINGNRNINNNTNNATNGIVNKNKYNKTFNNKNYQNSTKKDKNKFHKKSNNHFNIHNSFNNKNTNNNNNNNNFNQINTNNINNNDNNHKSNYRNKNNIYQIDNPKINKFHMDNNNNNRKSYTNIIATPPDTEIINNESNASPPATSPITMNIPNTNHHTSLDRPNANTSMNQIPTFMNPLNTFNNLFPSQTQNQIPTLSNAQTSPQYSNEIPSPISLKRNNPNNIIITSSVNNVIDNPPTIHSGNSVNSGINPSIFNSPTFTKDNQKQQVFFQNNVQYNGKIYKLDPLTSSGYIQLSDEVISVLLNDTRNEGKSFELIKSYLVYFSYSDVEVSHLKNMKIGDTVSFKVKMTFIAPNNTNNSIKSSNLSLLDDEDNSITQAFDIFIKNKNNIPPDVLEMMKMMENIF